MKAVTSEVHVRTSGISSADMCQVRVIRVKLVCEGCRVEVKVTGAKVVHRYSHNVKLRPAIATIL